MQIVVCAVAKGKSRVRRANDTAPRQLSSESVYIFPRSDSNSTFVAFLCCAVLKHNTLVYYTVKKRERNRYQERRLLAPAKPLPAFVLFSVS